METEILGECVLGHMGQQGKVPEVEQTWLPEVLLRSVESKRAERGYSLAEALQGTGMLVFFK